MGASERGRNRFGRPAGVAGAGWLRAARWQGFLIGLVLGWGSLSDGAWAASPIRFPPTGERRGSDLCVSWDGGTGPGPWYTFTVAGTGTWIGWLGDHGVEDSGFVWCHLGPQVAWPKGVWAFFPLFTYGWTNLAGAEAVDFLRTPLVTLAVNDRPLAHLGLPDAGPADLRGGELRLWVAEWNSKTNHAVYSYRRSGFAWEGPGWVRSTVTLIPDPGAWELHAFAGTPSSLSEILARPQQWGVAVIGARPGEHPEGRLGFDELRVSRRFRATGWPSAADAIGWYQDARAVEVVPAAAEEAGNGFARVSFDRTAGEVVPDPVHVLWTSGFGGGGAVHPVNLRAHNTVRFRVNAAPPGSDPADLRGGRLQFVVGRWTDPGHHGFYRYRHEGFAPGPGGWRTHRWVLTARAEDWELYASGDAGVPALAEVLGDPQWWGLGLFGASAPPTGSLGFDDWAVTGWTEAWDRANAMGDWESFLGGAAPGAPGARSRALEWREHPGEAEGGYGVCALDGLEPWEAGGGGLRFPLHTASDGPWVDLHELRELRFRLSLRPAPLDPAADLGGGALCVFAGHWQDAANYAFYVFRQPLAVPSSPGWAEVRQTLSVDPADWLVFDSSAGLPGSGGAPNGLRGRDRFGLECVARKPTRWGLAIVGGTRSPTGWLGVDSGGLEVRPPESTALAARQLGRGCVLSWGPLAGGVVEVWDAGRLDAGAGWRLRQVWDDGFLAPPHRFRATLPTGTGTGAGAGADSGFLPAVSIPTEAGMGFFRLVFEGTPNAE